MMNGLNKLIAAFLIQSFFTLPLAHANSLTLNYDSVGSYASAYPCDTAKGADKVASDQKILDSDINKIYTLLDPVKKAQCAECASINMRDIDLQNQLSFLQERKLEISQCALKVGATVSDNKDETLMLLDTKASYQKELDQLTAITASQRTAAQNDQIQNYQNLLKTIDEAVATSKTTGQKLNLSCDATCEDENKKMEALLQDKACFNVPECAACATSFLALGEDGTQGTGKDGILGSSCSAFKQTKTAKTNASVIAGLYTANAAVCVTGCILTLNPLTAGAAEGWNKACQFVGYGVAATELVLNLTQKDDMSTATSDVMGAVMKGAGPKLAGNQVAGFAVDTLFNKAATNAANKVGTEAGNAASRKLMEEVNKGTKQVVQGDFAKVHNEAAKTASEGKIKDLKNSISACVGAAVVVGMAAMSWGSNKKAKEAENQSCSSITDYTKTLRTKSSMTASCKVQAGIQLLNKNRMIGLNTTNSPSSITNIINNTGKDPSYSTAANTYKEFQKKFPEVTSKVDSFLPTVQARAERSGTVSMSDIAKAVAPNLSSEQLAALDHYQQKVQVAAESSPLYPSEKMAGGSGGGLKSGGSAPSSTTDDSMDKALAALMPKTGETPKDESQALDTGLHFGDRNPASAEENEEINHDISKNIFGLVNKRLLEKKKDRSISDLAPALQNNK